MESMYLMIFAKIYLKIYMDDLNDISLQSNKFEKYKSSKTIFNDVTLLWCNLIYLSLSLPPYIYTHTHTHTYIYIYIDIYIYIYTHGDSSSYFYQAQIFYLKLIIISLQNYVCYIFIFILFYMCHYFSFWSDSSNQVIRFNPIQSCGTSAESMTEPNFKTMILPFRELMICKNNHDRVYGARIK